MHLKGNPVVPCPRVRPAHRVRYHSDRRCPQRRFEDAWSPVISLSLIGAVLLSVGTMLGEAVASPGFAAAGVLVLATVWSEVLRRRWRDRGATFGTPAECGCLHCVYALVTQRRDHSIQPDVPCRRALPRAERDTLGAALGRRLGLGAPETIALDPSPAWYVAVEPELLPMWRPGRQLASWAHLGVQLLCCPEHLECRDATTVVVAERLGELAGLQVLTVPDTTIAAEVITQFHTRDAYQTAALVAAVLAEADQP